jgi:hypothetical protein
MIGRRSEVGAGLLADWPNPSEYLAAIADPPPFAPDEPRDISAMLAVLG